jgi:hypothetical protein
MHERLPNAHFPVHGVLARSEESGPRQMNIKSQKRKPQLHTKSIDYLKNGRTPFVVTSESPGPAKYVSQPDYAFLPPPSPLTKQPPKSKSSPSTGADPAQALNIPTLTVEATTSTVSNKPELEANRNKVEEVGGDQEDQGEDNADDDGDDEEEREIDELMNDAKKGGADSNIDGGDKGDESEDSGWSSSDEMVEDIIIEEIGTELQTKKWTKEELNSLWSKYDNNNSGQVSFAEIEKTIVEHFPELDNKEVMRQ